MLMIPNDNDNTMNTKAVIEIVIDGLTRLFLRLLARGLYCLDMFLYVVVISKIKVYFCLVMAE